MGRILGAVPGLPGALAVDSRQGGTMVQLRLTLSASELALLPFELAKVPVSATVTAADNAAVCYSCHTSKGKSYADSVTVAAMPSFACNLLPPILKIFRARFPQVNVTVHDLINEQVLEMVRVIAK